jgi:hypothetical protein
LLSSDDFGSSVEQTAKLIRFRRATAAVLGGALWPTFGSGGLHIGLGAYTLLRQPHADGEAVGQDEPHRAAKRFRITGLPLGDYELELLASYPARSHQAPTAPAAAIPSGGSLPVGLALLGR